MLKYNPKMGIWNRVGETTAGEGDYINNEQCIYIDKNLN